MRIKALTIRQPWASLFALNVKHMETRTWDTAYRGPVAIHAGQAWPCRVGESVSYGPHYEVERDAGGLLLRSDLLSWPYRLPMGAVVAVGDLFQTRSTTNTEHRPDDVERSLGDHSPGRYAWSITSMSPLPEPIQTTGHQGLWWWDLSETLNKRLRYPIRDA